MRQCRSRIPEDSPERLGIEGRAFFTNVPLHALTLLGTAEGQQGQNPQPEVRLAVVRCLLAAAERAHSGLPFLAEPSQCIELAKAADRVMAGFAAAPKAASAASVMMSPISKFLTVVGGCVPEHVQRLSRTRRSLLASVQRLLEGPAPFLTGANVAARGAVVVSEAASTIHSAIHTALWVGGCAYADDIFRPAALLLQQCEALLVDSPIVAQLRVRQRRPLCSLQTRPIAVATMLAYWAEGASGLVINHIQLAFNADTRPHPQNCIVAASQQQLLALSAAVTRTARVHRLGTEPPRAAQQPGPAAYKGASLLADVAMISASALHEHPSSICQPAGLAATVASGAVAVLAFAPCDSSSRKRPVNIEQYMPGCMEYATKAAKFLHVLAQQLRKHSRANAEAARFALVSEEVAQSLVQLLLWLSEPTTAVATASGVLAEALPALWLMGADEGMRQILAAADGAHAWEPVSAALRRRLPRRMAARFLPDLDRISAVVAGSTARATGSVPDNAAVAAADAAMARLMQVQPASPHRKGQTDATESLIWCNCSVLREHLLVVAVEGIRQ